MTKFRVRVGNQSVSESPYNPYLESQSIHHKKKLSAATLHFVPPKPSLRCVLSVKWLKSAIIEICWYSICKTVKLKPFVFALFSQNGNQRLTFVRKSLILRVDQPGLEPGTSRLWVCCSNQLSYKSVPQFPVSRCKSSIFPWNLQDLSPKFW